MPIHLSCYLDAISCRPRPSQKELEELACSIVAEKWCCATIVLDRASKNDKSDAIEVSEGMESGQSYYGSRLEHCRVLAYTVRAHPRAGLSL